MTSSTSAATPATLSAPLSARNDFNSVYAAFAHSAAVTPDKPFLCITSDVAAAYDIAAGEISYQSALNTVHMLRDAYLAAGYGRPQDRPHRIGLMVDNRPSYFFHWFALNALGASVVPVNAEFTAAEQAYLLEHSEACLLISSVCHLDTAARAVAASGVNIPIVVDAENEFAPSLPRLPSPDRSKNAADERDLTPTNECAVLFTSGSTGTPKACLLSNEYFLDMGYWYRDIGGLCSLTFATERLITPLPLTHMNAMATSAMAMIVTSGCLVQLDRFHPKTWWTSVRESGATMCHYLGVMPAILLQLDESKADTDHALKFGFGAGVNPAHHAKFELRFGFPLLEAWAMTETGSGGCVIANHEPRHVGTSCFGKPDPAHVIYRLIDESGQDADQGELQVKRAGDNPRKSFFTAYYKNKEATEQGWADGWWHTGDVVKRNPDGTLSFVDRSKNIIRRSGENIAALEVEAVLSRYLGLRMVAVTPAPDEIRGEEVMACVILDDTAEASEATALSLFKHAATELAYYKTPGYVAFLTSMPLTATQKPKRNEIKRLARRLIDAAQDDAQDDGTSGDDPDLKQSMVFDLRARKKKMKA